MGSHFYGSWHVGTFRVNSYAMRLLPWHVAIDTIIINNATHCFCKPAQLAFAFRMTCHASLGKQQGFALFFFMNTMTALTGHIRRCITFALRKQSKLVAVNIYAPCLKRNI